MDDATFKQGRVRRALQTAGDARADLWDAMRKLEEELGFKDGNVPDAVDTYLFDATADLAGRLISEEDAARIVRTVDEKTPEDWDAE